MHACGVCSPECGECWGRTAQPGRSDGRGPRRDAACTSPARLPPSLTAETSEKVLKSAKLEEIRLTILRNMLQYHPESGEQLAWGSEEARSVSAVAVRDLDSTRPLGQRK